MAYADLLEDVADRLDRDDLETRLPRWLIDVEARLNRLLRDPQMEVSTTLTGDGADLPADFGEMISLGTADGNPLTQMGNVEYASIRPQSGVSRYFTIREGKVYYVPGSATATLSYRRTIPALTSVNSTNWLLELAPDVYKLGVLYEAAKWDHDRDAAADYKALWDEAIAELKADGVRRKWGSGAISPRIRRA